MQQYLNVVWEIVDLADLRPLLLAFLLGGAIGLEREIHGRPAGLRTHILVCISAAMLTVFSKEAAIRGVDLGPTGRIVLDPNRMGAGLMTGIGFLGAATVIRSGELVRGLTTAACIWFVAGLGIVIGRGDYALAIAGTLLVLFVLVVVNKLAHVIRPVVYRRVVVRADRVPAEPLAGRIRELLTGERMRVLDVASRSDEEGGLQLTFYIALKNRLQAPAIVETIAAIDGVHRAQWTLIE